MTYIEQYCRGDVNTLQSVVLDQRLQVVGDTVPTVQATVFAWLCGDLKLGVDSLRVYTYSAGQIGQSFVGLVPGLVDNVPIKVFRLLVEQSF